MILVEVLQWHALSSETCTNTNVIRKSWLQQRACTLANLSLWERKVFFFMTIWIILILLFYVICQYQHENKNLPLKKKL